MMVVMMMMACQISECSKREARRRYPTTSHSGQQQSILRKASSQRKGHISWEDQPRAASDVDSSSVVEAEEDYDNFVLDASLIWEPADLWKGTHQQLQELWVEMCLFARLGFIQPPCCLQGTTLSSGAEPVGG
jgi:hypothetical protein